MNFLNKNNKFHKYFNIVIEQDVPAEDSAPIDDQQALEQGLEPETDPADFNVKPINPEIQSKSLDKITDFILKIEEFSSFLNDPDNESSLNNFLNIVDKEGSLLQGISRESNKVTTVAENLASLAEAFRGQLMVAKRKFREKQTAREDF